MVNFEDGILVKGAYVIIDGKEYPVIMPEYSGDTPMTKENLNKMQNDLHKEIEAKFNTLKGTVLYENGEGTSTDFNLTDSIANHVGKKLKIYGYDITGREGSTEVCIRSGTVKARIALADYIEGDTRLIQETFADLVITNNQVTVISNSYINFTNGSSPYIGKQVATDAKVKIIKVEVV